MTLPNGWKNVRLSELGTFSKGSGIKRDEANSGSIPAIRYGEIYTAHNDYIKQFQSFISEKVAKEATLLKNGDLLFSCSGETKEDIGKCVAFVSNERAYAGGDIIILSPTVPCDSKYIGFLCNSSFVNKQRYSFAQGDSIVHISSESIGKIEIPFPPLNEQKKIAATLSVWDSAIEKMEKLIEAKESQKKFLITKSIKFSDDKKASGLTEIKLSDVFDEVCEKNHPDEDVLTIIQGVGTVLRENSGREIIYDKNSLSNYKYVKKGDFIIHLRSFEGGLEVANQDGIVSPAYIILRPKIKVSTIYLYALFHTNEFINRTIAPAVEGARDGRSIKYDALKNQTIILPNISEQQSVAELFLEADNEISLLKQQFENYKMQKQGLMQKLLTGQWRVK